MKDICDYEMIKILSEWQNFLINEKCYSNHTVSSYVRDVESFLSFVNIHIGEKISVNSLQLYKIADFRSWLSSRKKLFEINSTYRAVSSVKNLFKFMRKIAEFNNPFINSLRLGRNKNNLPKALNEEDMNLILEDIYNNWQKNWVGKRNYSLLLVIYATGLRISEALSITKAQIYLKYLLIKGKGKKERIIPLIDEIAEILKDYVNSIPYNLEDEDFIFLGERGKILKAPVFQTIIRNLRRKLGLPESTTPHAFRHSFATHLLSRGGDLRSIQELLGHSSLTSTQKYTKIDSNQLFNIYQKSHPRK